MSLTVLADFVQEQIRSLPPLSDLPNCWPEVCKIVYGRYLADDVITRVANKIWELEGRPDGDSYDACGLKRKDVHWARAKMLLMTAADDDIAAAWHDLQNDSLATSLSLEAIDGEQSRS